MQIGDKVVIGGRTMLRPGFALTGLTGTIVETASNAAPGAQTVRVDWAAHGYGSEAIKCLPVCVNVETEHLYEPKTSDCFSRTEPTKLKPV